jgi:release factor glutamine methyltransferase
MTTGIDRLWTVLDLLKWGTDFFAGKEVDSPRLTTELMLCNVLGCTRVQLYSTFERPLSKTELATLRGFVQRRVAGEPLQYITSEGPFFGHVFHVTPDVLIPRPETELIADHALRYCRGHRDTRALDIGTGSGCIPISVAIHAEDSQWVAVDVSDAAAAVARQNAERLGVAQRVAVTTMDFLAAVPEGPFDLVTMNPPYIPAAELAEVDSVVRDYEPHGALTDGADGLTFHRRLADVLAGAPFLTERGEVLVEVMAGQADEVEALYGRNGGQTTVIADMAGIPRMVRWRPQ